MKVVDLIENIFSIIINRSIDIRNIPIDNEDLEFWAYQYPHVETNNVSSFFESIAYNQTMNLVKLINIFNNGNEINLEEITIQQLLVIISIDPQKYFKIGTDLKAFENQKVSFESILSLVNSICDLYQSLKESYQNSRFLRFACSVVDVFIGERYSNKDLKKLSKIFNDMLNDFQILDKKQLATASNDVIAARGNLRSLETLKKKMEMPKRTPVSVGKFNFVPHHRTPKPTPKINIPKELLNASSLEKINNSTSEIQNCTFGAEPSSISTEIEEKTDDKHQENETKTEFVTEIGSTAYEIIKDKVEDGDEDEDEEQEPERRKKKLKEKAVDIFLDIIEEKVSRHKNKKKDSNKQKRGPSNKTQEAPLRMPIKNSGSVVSFFLPSKPKYMIQREKDQETHEENFLYHRGDIAVAILKDTPRPSKRSKRPPRVFRRQISDELNSNASIDARIERAKIHRDNKELYWRLQKEAALMKLIVDNTESKDNFYPLEEYLYYYTLPDSKSILKSVSLSIKNFEPILLTAMKCFGNSSSNLGHAFKILELLTKDIPASTKEPKEYLWRGLNRESNFTRNMDLLFGSVFGMNTSGFRFRRIVSESSLKNSSFYEALKYPLIPERMSDQEVEELKRLIRTNGITMNELLSKFNINYSLSNLEHTLNKVINILESNFPINCHGSSQIIADLKKKYHWLSSHASSPVTPQEFATKFMEDVQLFNSIIKSFLNNETIGELLKAINPDLDIDELVSFYKTRRMPSITNLMDLFFHRRNRLHFATPFVMYFINLRLIEGSKQVTYRELFESELIVLADRVISRLSRWSFNKILIHNYGQHRADVIQHIFRSLESELLMF